MSNKQTSNDFELPEFKKLPRDQRQITSFFKSVPLEDKWKNIERDINLIPAPLTPVYPSTSTTNIPNHNQIDPSIIAENSKSRVKWSENVKTFAVNHHLHLKGTVQETIRDLQRIHPGSIYQALTVSTLHSWLPDSKKRKHKPNETSSLEKKGRKSYLPDHLLDEIKSFIGKLIQTKTRITTKALLSHLKAMIQTKGYGDYLVSNGGQFKMGQVWLRWFLRNKMNLSKRQPTTAAQKLPEDWEHQIYRLSVHLAALVAIHEIPKELVVNSDQTGVQLVVSGKKTWTTKGAKEVPIVGNYDGRQITAMVSSSASGDMPPIQLIFTGTEGVARSIPPAELVKDLINDGWNLTQTPTHWSTITTMKVFVSKLLVPYYERKIKELNLSNDKNKHQRVVWIIDCWSVHRSKEFREYMSSNYPWILLLYVPASCTSKGQPQDISIQKPLKDNFNYLFDSWATDQIANQLGEGLEPDQCKLDLRIKNLKVLVANWLYESHKKCSEDKKNVLMGWQKPGYLEAWTPELQNIGLKEYHRGTLNAPEFIEVNTNDGDILMETSQDQNVDVFQDISCYEPVQMNVADEEIVLQISDVQNTEVFQEIECSASSQVNIMDADIVLEINENQNIEGSQDIELTESDPLNVKNVDPIVVEEKQEKDYHTGKEHSQESEEMYEDLEFLDEEFLHDIVEYEEN